MIWLLGLVGLLLVEIVRPSPIIPVILVLGGFELWRRWRDQYVGSVTCPPFCQAPVTLERKGIAGALSLICLTRSANASRIGSIISE